MTPSQTRRRSRREFEDENNEEATRYDSEGTPEHRDGPKRWRRSVANEKSSSDDAHGGEDEGLEDNTRRTGASGKAPASAEVVEYQPGAIRRVKVENFVTYEMAEFFPGPNLK